MCDVVCVPRRREDLKRRRVEEISLERRERRGDVQALERLEERADSRGLAEAGNDDLDVRAANEIIESLQALWRVVGLNDAQSERCAVEAYGRCPTYREVTLSHERVLAHLEGQVQHESSAHRGVAPEQLQVYPSSYRQNTRSYEEAIAAFTQIPSGQLQVRQVRDIHYTTTPRQLPAIPHIRRHPKRKTHQECSDG